ncbi:MAG: hypothetical protein ACRC28_04905 [Clostridium sp.]|uniref:hypothetical protein n=1 Tax=Clostridium sp. TaxID=1506 RepID=UPI003F35F161
MKKKVMILLLLILSMVTIGSTTEIGIQSYNELEERVRDITEFDSNGVRFEYTSSNSVEKEKERLKEVYKKSYEVNEDGNSMKLVKGMLIEVNLWEEKGKTYVNLTINNEDEEYCSKELERELLKANSKEVENKKIFSFYKGKVLEENREEVLEFIKKDENNNLKIENGYTWKNKVGKEMVNFGLVNYDTGLHLIIGTPVIFTTY